MVGSEEEDEARKEQEMKRVSEWSEREIKEENKVKSSRPVVSPTVTIKSLSEREYNLNSFKHCCGLIARRVFMRETKTHKNYIL